MNRVSITPRPNWQAEVEKYGLVFHQTEGRPYWDESVYYAFSAREVDILEAATNEIQRLYLEVGQHIIDNDRFKELGIPDNVIPLIKWAWEAEPPAIYGRMDLAYDGKTPPKLLEYNADTPTALLEASVIQWYWLEAKFPKADQFNSIHERLVAKWKELRDYLTGSPLYFIHVDDAAAEDTMTVTYLRDTAEEAGLKTSAFLVQQLGWDSAQHHFVDLDEKPVGSVFKLYPWEWLAHEEYAPHMVATYKEMQWIEPIWKMLFSNKGVLAILWELFPHHPNLLPAYLDGPRDMKEYVRKPLLSREGANIQVKWARGDFETGGDYGEEGYVHQQLVDAHEFGDGYFPVIGSWVIDGESAGMGIREAKGLVTDNRSTFVPHLFT